MSEKRDDLIGKHIDNWWRYLDEWSIGMRHARNEDPFPEDTDGYWHPPMSRNDQEDSEINLMSGSPDEPVDPIQVAYDIAYPTWNASQTYGGWEFTITALSTSANALHQLVMVMRTPEFQLVKEVKEHLRFLEKIAMQRSWRG